MKFKLSVTFVLGSILLFTVSCKHEPDIVSGVPSLIENTCNQDSVYFQTEILPLLISSCATSGCHESGSGGEAFPITDYASIVRKVKPGNAKKSELYKVINRSIPELRMPPAPRQPLSQAFIAKFGDWIDQGALNNVCNDDNCSDTLDVITFSRHISPMVQNYCQGCHSGNKPGGDIRLTNYAEIVNSVTNGKFVGSIKHLSGYKEMPKNQNKLSDCKIRQVELWIESGTPEN
ncbi:MAG: hypothetical protein ACOYN5_04580 [Bacteroidales bacterium]